MSVPQVRPAEAQVRQVQTQVKIKQEPAEVKVKKEPSSDPVVSDEVTISIPGTLVCLPDHCYNCHCFDLLH